MQYIYRALHTNRVPFCTIVNGFQIEKLMLLERLIFIGQCKCTLLCASKCSFSRYNEYVRQNCTNTMEIQYTYVLCVFPKKLDKKISTNKIDFNKI